MANHTLSTYRPTTRETRWLAALARHGPLSSELLLELTADTHRCRDTGKRQLKQLRDAGYLRLPPAQRRIAKADFNPYVYDLTKQGQSHLGASEPMPKEYAVRGPWWHGFRTSMLTGTIDWLSARTSGEFIPGTTILQRSGASLGVPLGHATLIPDQLFALKQKRGYRVFALEVDCGTEPYTSSARRRTLTQLIGRYRRAINEDSLRRHYALTAPVGVLCAFTLPHRADRFLELIAEHAPDVGASFLVQVIPNDFPRLAEMERVLRRGWRRSNYPTVHLLEGKA